ncbi:MAG: efflux transporter periplasmic adaptor subunit [Confluentimicrobium sp.]|uniref:HlyD family secretion protein n=2 Tax=Roseobacteraceae TaxID=2854170 RepID=A0A2T5H0M4_9RHOB|nr:HlyD family efflux transporter periplasmic adaptor subunit [Celeribacter persicus]MBC57238.1 efflux transporter periplasmic adaptor subunit [Actibacterium sp.]PTQ65142.1 HlyD family secretion protein [Celeribacter persicus]
MSVLSTLHPPILRIVVASFLSAFLSVTAAPATAGPDFDTLLEKFGKSSGEEGIYSSNGRIEAQTVDVATKYAGRIDSVTAAEGDLLSAGDVIAQMGTADATAQLNAAKAAVLRANAGLTVAQATLMQAESALSVAQTTYDRVVKLHDSGTTSQSTLDDATNALNSAKATVEMAKAQIEDAKASIAAAEADQDQVQLALDDLTITAPLRGRVLYRLHEPSEVIDAGYPVVTMLDLSNVYMNIYLPATVIGTLAVGDEARLILDPISDYVVPATITFISPQSQFTPKSVETQEQREELVFRVKLSVPRALLAKYESLIKSGVRGIGFVRTEPDVDWPEHLTVNVPE